MGEGTDKRRKPQAPSNHNIFLVASERIDVERGTHLLYSTPMLDLRAKSKASWRAVADTLGAAMQLGGAVPVRYYT